MKCSLEQLIEKIKFNWLFLNREKKFYNAKFNVCIKIQFIKCYRKCI